MVLFCLQLPLTSQAHSKCELYSLFRLQIQSQHHSITTTPSPIFLPTLPGLSQSQKLQPCALDHSLVVINRSYLDLWYYSEGLTELTNHLINTILLGTYIFSCSFILSRYRPNLPGLSAMAIQMVHYGQAIKPHLKLRNSLLSHPKKSFHLKRNHLLVSLNFFYSLSQVSMNPYVCPLQQAAMIFQQSEKDAVTLRYHNDCFYPRGSNRLGVQLHCSVIQIKEEKNHSHLID